MSTIVSIMPSRKPSLVPCKQHALRDYPTYQPSTQSEQRSFPVPVPILGPRSLAKLAETSVFEISATIVKLQAKFQTTVAKQLPLPFSTRNPTQEKAVMTSAASSPLPWGMRNMPGLQGRTELHLYPSSSKLSAEDDWNGVLSSRNGRAGKGSDWTTWDKCAVKMRFLVACARLSAAVAPSSGMPSTAFYEKMLCDRQTDRQNFPPYYGMQI